MGTVALRRMIALNQEAPVLQETGQTFAEVAQSRGVARDQAIHSSFTPSYQSLTSQPSLRRAILIGGAGSIPNPMPLSSSTAGHSAPIVGRTPWSAADAPVRIPPAGDGCSPWAKSVRSGRADQGVRPTRPTAVTEWLRFAHSFFRHSCPPSRAAGAVGPGPWPSAPELASFRIFVHQALPPTVTGRARNRRPRPLAPDPRPPKLASFRKLQLVASSPPQSGNRRLAVGIHNATVAFHIIASKGLIPFHIIAILHTLTLIIPTCRLAVKNDTSLPA